MDILDHIRLITVVARSARIEAALVQTSQRGFSDFFEETVGLIGQAKQTIESSARDHDRLKTLLGQALVRQSEFERAHGATLRTLADKLDWTLGQIEDRHRRSVALTADAKAQSDKLAGAVSLAIVALQSGDNIRQRLEHSLGALGVAGAVVAGTIDATEDEVATWDVPDRRIFEHTVRQIVVAQLGVTAETLAADAQDVDAALKSLADETAATVGLSQALYGGDASDQASFLTILGTELAQASYLMEQCQTARSVVNEVIDALTTFLARFENASADLSETVSNMVVIGTNSGLRAARRGNEGRGLVVISHELKAVADQIARDAKTLAPNFELMQGSVAGLKARQGGINRLGELDETMKTSLAQMQASGSRLKTTLGLLAREATQFATLVEDARGSFAEVAIMADAIAAAGELLDAITPEDDAAPADAPGLKAYMDRAILKTYTMQGERAVYQSVLGGLGWSEEPPPIPPPMQAASDGLDSMLF